MHQVEIAEGPLSRERQAALAAVLVRELGVDSDEAELTALVTPCVVGPVGSSVARDRLLGALAAAGFAARPVVPAAPAPAYAPPAFAEAPVHAAPPPAYTPAAPAARTNTAVAALAAVLAVVAVGLGIAALNADRDDPGTTTVVETSPETYAAGGDVGVAGSVAIDDVDAFEGDGVEPDGQPSGGGDFALGYSPDRGVNWDAFARGGQTRFAGAPNGTPIPVRDAPSARYGRAVDDVPPGGQVYTDGCLPRRPEDGGRWCRTETADGEGWIYDRYLVDQRRAQAPPPAALQATRLADGQVTVTLSEGGQTWRLPRALSAGTSVSGLQRRTLAGRDVVQFEARDARWATTYYWEYRQARLHFVGQDTQRGGTNVSDQPGSYEVIYAARGSVPSATAGPRAPRASQAPASQAPTSAVVVLGSYTPDDVAGLQGRIAQARQTGLTLQAVPSERYGMSPGHTVIVAGPFDPDTATRVLAEAQYYVPDAFIKSLR